MTDTSLPVVIIGAGPVGLAAAAHVRSRALTPLVLEAGDAVGAGIRRWQHVRMFSPVEVQCGFGGGGHSDPPWVDNPGRQ